MEQDYRNGISVGEKRPLEDDRHGVSPEPKRQHTLPFGYNHDDGPAMVSSYMPPSWGAPGGIPNEFVNILHQSTLDTDISGRFESDYAADLPVLSDRSDLGPGFSTHETSSAVVPIQSSQVEFHASRVYFSLTNFQDGGPFETSSQTDWMLNPEFLFGDISQEEITVTEEFTAKVVQETHIREVSEVPSVLDDYSRIPPQIAGDPLQKLEGGYETFQKGCESMSQAPATVLVEAVGAVVPNEKAHLGQLIDIS